MRIHHLVWLKVQPGIVDETRAAGLLDVRQYLKCDIKWENETDYPNKYVDFTFHNTEDELFYRLLWGIVNDKRNMGSKEWFDFYRTNV